MISTNLIDSKSSNAMILLRIPDSAVPGPVTDSPGFVVVNLYICRYKKDVSGVRTRISLTIGKGVLICGNLYTTFRRFSKEFGRLRGVGRNCGVERKGGGVWGKGVVGGVTHAKLTVESDILQFAASESIMSPHGLSSSHRISLPIAMRGKNMPKTSDVFT